MKNLGGTPTDHNDINITRSLVDDLNITHHDNGIGEDRFHLMNDFTGSFPKDEETVDLHDFSLGRRVAISKDGLKLAVAGLLFNDLTETFRWIVKIFKKDSVTWKWDTSNPIEVVEEENSASPFESDAYVEIALSGDGTALYVANAKPKRIDNEEQPLAKVFVYREDFSFTSPVSFETLPTPDVNTGIGYYFAGLQVDVANDPSRAVVGIPYKGEVLAYDLTTHQVLVFPNVGPDSHLGRSVAISKDGTTIAASAPGDNKIYIARSSDFSTWSYEEIPGTAAGITTGNDLGSSLAINEDGTIIVIGSKNHDADKDIDKGSVTVMIKKDAAWSPLGQTLTGERGEGASNGYYYVGDRFGESVALSEKNSYTIKVVIGAPKNDPDGISGSDYYNGHVEVYEINPDEENAQFLQIAYDIDGGTSGEKSGTSVAIDSEGKSILIGSPGFEASSVGGFFEGVAKIYEQTEYSSEPSSIPSSVPSITMAPSSEPSLSLVPSSSPSITMNPSSEPSLSSVPSSVPSLSAPPSSLPSGEFEKEFLIISTFGQFGEDNSKDWCLTAFDKIDTSKLFVRPCRAYTSRSENLQLWKLTPTGELKLAGSDSGFCVMSIFRQIELKVCEGDVSTSGFSFDTGSIIQTKNDKVWKLGFDPESRFERVRLYRDGTLNEVLDKWALRYLFEVSVGIMLDNMNLLC